MKKRIQLFNEREEIVTEELISFLEKSGNESDLKRVNSNMSALRSLAKSISKYPSLLNQQHLGSNFRTIDTLVENLCTNRDLSILLHTPTKAVLGRSFTIAKINFFLLLSYLCRDLPSICEKKTEISMIVSSNVFSVITEDVFVSIISDALIPYEIRSSAAKFLARIWDYRIYRGVKELSPILTDLWKLKKELNPSYGTMTGITEITSFCKNSHPLWSNFFEDKLFNQDKLEALKEYLMGLSHEEMKLIQSHMSENCISSLSGEDIDSVLKKPRAYVSAETDDPRDMYTFFSKRKANAEFRQKSKMEGPCRTIEEYIMCYLIDSSIIKNEE